MKLFIISILCAFSLSTNAQSTDYKILKSIYADSAVFKDKSAKIISISVAPISIAAPATMLFVGLIKKDSILIHNGLKTGGSLLLNTLVTISLKYVVKRDRPFNEYPLTFHAKENAGGYSFPSQHTSTAFSTATSLSLAYPKWYIIAPAYLWACSTAYSRMYLGVHYPTDVLAGAVIGTACSFASFKIEKWLLTKKRHR